MPKPQDTYGTETVVDTEKPKEKRFLVSLKPKDHIPMEKGQPHIVRHIRGGYVFTKEKSDHEVTESELQKFYISVPSHREKTGMVVGGLVFDPNLSYREI